MTTYPGATRSEAGAQAQSWRRYLAMSDDPIPRLARWLHRLPNRIHVPAPRLLVKPLLWIFLLFRGLYHGLFRILVAEPLFKAYCLKCGKRFRADTFVHWVRGKGDLIVGDDVVVDGQCSFVFARRFADRPRLEIGDRTGIGHGCAFIVGKRIRIGKDCMLSGHIRVADSNGHTTDMNDRRMGLPPPDDEVREVTIGDNVWIGVHSLIFPGVRIGDGAVVAAGSVVRNHVPPSAVVAGNPARVVFRLKRPQRTTASGDSTPA